MTYTATTTTPAVVPPYINDTINMVDELGNVVPSENAIISFLRPAYDGDLKTHVYKRAIPTSPPANFSNILSTSSQVSYNDLIMGEYIHYIPNPVGGQGQLDKSPYAVKTDVTISRNLRVATYSPY